MAKWGRKPKANASKAELAARTASRERYRNLSPEERKRQWRDGRDPERVKADDKARKASPSVGERKKVLARGKVKASGKGCQVCGAKAHAHHTDYDKPLRVQWLCAQHHAQQHSGGSSD